MEQRARAQKIALSIRELDKTHQFLNRKLINIMKAPDHEFCGRFLHIVKLLETDFREEEELMELIDFPDLHDHRKDHANLLATLHHVTPQALNGQNAIPRQVINILPQWLLEHLVKRDASLFKALNVAGAQPVFHEPAVSLYKTIKKPLNNRNFSSP